MSQLFSFIRLDKSIVLILLIIKEVALGFSLSTSLKFRPYVHVIAINSVKADTFGTSATSSP